ncbi:hypothetical protein MHZ92_17970 [Sporosarcina sp. ACRSL]|uniref:hypothetical protein n=1 Tax=Sporosarcina sp. ACRSL TaxID=2918215 RepID=UPI001EF73062|nr:hypothetical protein [Sporosarcina sp. ACRSL]MCG7346003.1 hypothetical protein [Sporosarcina sp. ACRSL]
MDFLKLKFYIELMSISFGVVGLLYIVPMQFIVEGQPRVLTVVILMFLWFVIMRSNHTFYELWDKWFTKK